MVTSSQLLFCLELNDADEAFPNFPDLEHRLQVTMPMSKQTLWMNATVSNIAT